MRHRVVRLPSLSHSACRLAGLASAALLLALPAIDAGAVPLLSGRVFLGAALIDADEQRASSLSGAAAVAAGVLADAASASAGVGDLGGGNGRARYQAEFGRLKAEGQLSLTAPLVETRVPFDSGATGIARFEDIVTMNSPGLAGTQGSLRVRVDVDGNVRGDAAGEDRGIGSSVDAGWVLDLQLGNGDGGFQQRFGGCNQGSGAAPADACVEYGAGFGVWTTAPITFTFGAPTSIAMQLGAGVFSRTVRGGETSGAADLFNTVEWLDMVDVRDATGRRVTGFETTSLSGTNWAARMPIPFDPGPPTAVPAPAALPVLGLFACLLLRRRRPGLRH
jgi:hypothetical protein